MLLLFYFSQLVPPEVVIEYDRLQVNQNETLYLDCKVTSLTPVVTTWTFGSQFKEKKPSK
jgi:hypothetical protein